MKMVPLGEVVCKVERRNPAESPEVSFCYVDLSAVDQSAKAIVNYQLLTGREAPSRARQVLQTDDILVSTVRPNLNGVARVPRDLDGFIGSTGFCVVRPDSRQLDASFAFHWIRSPQFIDEMVRKATGASYPAISDSIVFGSRLPLPPLDEQRRIAAMLDKTDELRSKRREATAHLDALIASIFNEVIGNPQKNPRKFSRVRLDALGTITTGNTPSRNDRKNFGDYIEWIKTDNINTPNTYLTNSSEGLSEMGRKKARTAQSGAVLVTCIAGSPKVIGNVALADREVAFNQQINAFTPHAGPSLFWYTLLREMKPIVQAASTGGMTGMVSKSAMCSIEAIDVPRRLQDQFAERAAVIERLRSGHRAQLTHLDALFASLQHRAFKGEL